MYQYLLFLERFFSKVHYMPSQQMKGCDSFQIETVGVKSPINHDSSLIDTSSIAITNYNNQCTSILHKLSTIVASMLPKSIVQLLSTNNKSSLLPKSLERIGSLCHLLQRSSVEPLLPKLLGIYGSQLPLLNRICSYFSNFSQSAACNATAFGECSSTLLDRL